MPLEAAADLKSACSFGDVIRFAPARDCASRMIVKVWDWIIRSARASSRPSEISSRETPMPNTRCEGVNRSGAAARPIGSSARSNR